MWGRLTWTRVLTGSKEDRSGDVIAFEEVFGTSFEPDLALFEVDRPVTEFGCDIEALFDHDQGAKMLSFQPLSTSGVVEASSQPVGGPNVRWAAGDHTAEQFHGSPIWA